MLKEGRLRRVVQNIFGVGGLGVRIWFGMGGGEVEMWSKREAEK